MRSVLSFAVIALVLVGAAVLPAHAECGYFMKAGAACQPDHTVKISWQLALNGGCTDFNLSIERRCGLNGDWVEIATGLQNSPYIDGPSFQTNCLEGYYYRLKLTCNCSGEPVVTYSDKLGPVPVPCP